MAITSPRPNALIILLKIFKVGVCVWLIGKNNCSLVLISNKIPPIMNHKIDGIIKYKFSIMDCLIIFFKELLFFNFQSTPFLSAIPKLVIAF